MKICYKCKSANLDGVWVPTKNFFHKVTYTICPTCAKKEEKNCSGIIMLSGEFFKNHKDKLLKIVSEEEKNSRVQYPISKVLLIKKHGHPAIIKTNHPFLAIRIGKRFQTEFQGKLQIINKSKNKTIVKWFCEPVNTSKDAETLKS